MTYEQLRTTLIQLYKDLDITDEVPEKITYGDVPVEPIYEKIYQVLATDPTRYRSILDKYIDNNIITCFDPETRNNISKLYPDDEELAIKLLIDTASYYKIKYYPNESGSWEDEDCEKIYRLVIHCPDIYFASRFDDFYKENSALMKVFKKNNITYATKEGYEINPALIKLYTNRNINK